MKNIIPATLIVVVLVGIAVQQCGWETVLNTYLFLFLLTHAITGALFLFGKIVGIR